MRYINLRFTYLLTYLLTGYLLTYYNCIVESPRRTNKSAAKVSAVHKDWNLKIEILHRYLLFSRSYCTQYDPLLAW